MNGFGTLDQDPVSARAFYETAAEAGHVPSQRALAHCMREGIGGPVDLVDASRWERRAAEAGDAVALVNLAAAANAGGDPVAARAYLERAARAGLPEAAWRLSLMLLHGVGGPVDEARARQWLEQALGRPFEES
jgi:hypothetical protein